LKSPTATDRGAKVLKIVGPANLTAAHVGVVVTVSMNVWVTLVPPPNARTVTVYVPAGYASVTVTTPVVELAANVPLKLVLVETLMFVVLVGAASGITVLSVLSRTDVFG
jgi:hypothetical protein